MISAQSRAFAAALWSKLSGLITDPQMTLISRIESDGFAPIAKHSIRLYCESGSCL